MDFSLAADCELGREQLRPVGVAGLDQVRREEPVTARGGPLSLSTQPRSAADEQHYTPAEVGKLWGFSAQAMIRLFENEPGIVCLGTRTSRNGKQRRMFLRIPQSVMERKHEELVIK